MPTDWIESSNAHMALQSAGMRLVFNTAITVAVLFYVFAHHYSKENLAVRKLMASLGPVGRIIIVFVIATSVVVPGYAYVRIMEPDAILGVTIVASMVVILLVLFCR